MPKDSNRVTTLIAALNTDGITPVSIKADPTTHALKGSDGATGTDHGKPNAQRDSNRSPVLMGVSSTDGVTPVEIYADSNGNLLMQST
jgi:hypothetical protein